MPSKVTVFVDESGDSGFRKRSSSYLVIGYVVVENTCRVSNDVKKLTSKLSKTYGLDLPEFKFYKNRDLVRARFLKLMAKSRISCGYVAAKKSAAIAYLVQNPDKLYNYLAVHYPITHILTLYSPEELEYVIDKQSWTSARRKEFESYIPSKVTSSIMRSANYSDPIPMINIRLACSHNEPCLQVADYVAGSVFQKFERGKPQYLQILQSIMMPGWVNTWE